MRSVRTHRSARRMLLALLSLALIGLPAPARAAAAVPNPLVEGPLPANLEGNRLAESIDDTYPFFAQAPGKQLASHGFVEEEYTISGAANLYPASLLTVPVGVPYKTRILVRRPAAPARFNGTVLMEWQNVTAGYDLDALWWGLRPYAFSQGYAWVGVSAQRVGVEHLRGWSPARYGDLEQRNDVFSYDAFAQAAKAVRAPNGVDPMGGLDVERVIAIGASQSAGRMTTFFNSVRPQIEKVFDAYLFAVGSAPSGAAGPEPVFQVMSETDVSATGGSANTATFRRWEVTGTAHSGWHGRNERTDEVDRDLGGHPPANCADPPFSRIPMHYALNAAYDHLVEWITNGTPPPVADRITYSGTSIARDERGNALGGLRLPQHHVPTALNTGDNGGSGFCGLYGTHVPFDEPTLRALYPTHADYVASVDAATDASVAAGYMTAADAGSTKEDARAFTMANW